MTAVTALLAAANVWSLRQRELARTEVAPAPAPPRQSPVTRLDIPATITPAAPAPIPSISFDPGLEVDALLDASVELLCDGTRTEHIDFRRALDRSVISVVNLWNIHCDPCVAEFAEIADVLASAPRSVRFVAVNTFEQGWAHDSYRSPRAAAMPKPHVRLAERLVEPIFDELNRLAREQLRREPSGIPITFVIDCHHRLRWLKTGRIDREEAVELKLLLARLAHEGCARAPGGSVTESVCNPPPPPSRPRPTPIASRKDCTKCKSRMCKATPRGELVCDDSAADLD